MKVFLKQSAIVIVALVVCVIAFAYSLTQGSPDTFSVQSYPPPVPTTMYCGPVPYPPPSSWDIEIQNCEYLPLISKEEVQNP